MLKPIFNFFAGVLWVIVLLYDRNQWHIFGSIRQHYFLEYFDVSCCIHNGISTVNRLNTVVQTPCHDIETSVFYSLCGKFGGLLTWHREPFPPNKTTLHSCVHRILFFVIFGKLQPFGAYLFVKRGTFLGLWAFRLYSLSLLHILPVLVGSSDSFFTSAAVMNGDLFIYFPHYGTLTLMVLLF